MRSLITWPRRSGTGLEAFRSDMETLLQRFFGEPFLLEDNGRDFLKTWNPSVDVEETEKEILVKVDLPGVEAKDVNITIEENSLVLRGEKKEEKEEKKKNYHRVERFAGQFYREIPLPPGADTEKVAAASAKGVVTITIPKKAEMMPKKITVTPKG